MKIDVSFGMADEIFLQTLKDNLDTFSTDYNTRLNGGFPYGLFKKDLMKDLKIIKKHIKACERLIKYYDVEPSAYYEGVEE